MYTSDVACALDLDPWCSESFIEKFYKDKPWFARYFVFPSWVKEYKTKWKFMIESVAGDVDVVKLDITKLTQVNAAKPKTLFGF